jgi:hypothetical protein
MLLIIGLNPLAMTSAFTVPIHEFTVPKHHMNEVMNKNEFDKTPSFMLLSQTRNQRYLPRSVTYPNNSSIFSSKSNENNNTNRKGLSKKSRIQKLKILPLSIIIHTSTLFFTTCTKAKADHPFFDDPTGKVSLRPGMNIEDIEKLKPSHKEVLKDGQLSFDYNGSDEEVTGSSSSSNSNKAPKQKKEKKQSKYQYDDDEYFDDDFHDDGEDDESDYNVVPSAPSMISSSNKSSSSTAPKSSNTQQIQTINKLAGSAPTLTKDAESKLILKTVGIIMGPIFGVTSIREAIRWNREQRNVDKGIQIMEQQRLEYLNSKGDDGDEDDDDDDDDDEDDEDDEEDDEDEDDDDEDDKDKRKKSKK